MAMPEFLSCHTYPFEVETVSSPSTVHLLETGRDLPGFFLALLILSITECVSTPCKILNLCLGGSFFHSITWLNEKPAE